MPGVTGNPATGTVNPFVPGTVFGTGQGTTGSGLPIQAAPGSPYASLGSSSNIVSSSRTISVSQAGNISPSALFPAGSGTYNLGSVNSGTGLGLIPTIGVNVSPGGAGVSTVTTGGCFASFVGSTILSGSGRVVDAGTNWYTLHNGYKVYTAPCTTGCQGKVGDTVNWNGYNQQGSFLATKLSCS